MATAEAAAPRADQDGSTHRQRGRDMYFTEQRPGILRRLGLADIAENADVISDALEQSWSSLDTVSKDKYEAFAEIDEHRRRLEQLQKGMRSAREAPKLAKVIKEAITALGRAPPTLRASGPLVGVVVALEGLDRRMNNDVRAALGAQLGASVASPSALALARKAFGEAHGSRLVVLLRRWCTEKQRAPAKEQKSDKKTRQTAAAGKKHGDETSQDARKHVVERLKHILATHSQPDSQLEQQIEEQLHKSFGSNAKEYKWRARTLIFNLSAIDGGLCSRVLAGTLSPASLVHMEAEDLASDSLKNRRRMERDKYFKSEVCLQEPLPKRRRDLFFARQPHGRAADRFAAGHPDDEEDASQTQFQSQSQDRVLHSNDSQPNTVDPLPIGSLSMEEAVQEVSGPVDCDTSVSEDVMTIVECSKKQCHRTHEAAFTGLGSGQGSAQCSSSSKPSSCLDLVLIDGEADSQEKYQPKTWSSVASAGGPQASSTQMKQAYEQCLDTAGSAEDARLHAIDKTSKNDLQASEPNMMALVSSHSSSSSSSCHWSNEAVSIFDTLQPEDTSSDEALARFLQMMPSPSSESSSSSSSDSEWEQAPAPSASSTGVPQIQAETRDESLEQILAMGFQLEQAKAALQQVNGNVQEAVLLLCDQRG